MSDKISMDSDGNVTVQAGVLTKLAVDFTRENAGKKYSAHEIIVLALLTGITAGYLAAAETPET